MARLSKSGLVALAASVVVGTLGAGVASAEPIRLFAIGDSLTDGRDNAGSPATGGYRQLLSTALDQALIDHTFQGKRGEQNGQKWERHWGRPGISADDTGNYPYSKPPYNPLNSLVNDFVDRTNISPTGIRHPSIQGAHDFRDSVWGTHTAPTHTLLHIGTNSITDQVSSVGSSATQLNSLLRTFDLLDSTTVTGETGPLMRADGRILLANIIPKAVDFNTLSNTFEYNELISDKSSVVYNGLSQDFKDRVFIVDMFKVRVDDVIAGIQARNTGLDSELLLSYLQRDEDEWVDWIENYDEALGLPLGGGSLVLNDVLWKKNDNTYDNVHPGVWGYEVMAQVWANAIPEPTALAWLAMAGLGLASRRRA